MSNEETPTEKREKGDAVTPSLKSLRRPTIPDAPGESPEDDAQTNPPALDDFHGSVDRALLALAVESANDDSWDEIVSRVDDPEAAARDIGFVPEEDVLIASKRARWGWASVVLFAMSMLLFVGGALLLTGVLL